jgi:hypothetical protein
VAEQETKSIRDWLAQVNTADDPDGRKVIFRQADSFYSVSIRSILAAIQDNSQIFYQCRVMKAGAPLEQDVFMDRRYYRLQLNGNMLVDLNQLLIAINPMSPSRVFDIIDTGTRLPFVTSYGSIVRNGSWEGVNIMSADHCQMGSDAPTYRLQALVRVPAGGRRKKTHRTVRKRKMSRKRATSSWM